MIDILKKNLSKGKVLDLYLILIVGFAIFTFWDLPKTFYQQDEWQTLGHNLVNGFFTYIKDSNPLLIIFGEKRPFSNLMYSFFLGFYKFTITPSAIFAISISRFKCSLFSSGQKTFAHFRTFAKSTKAKIRPNSSG